MPPISGAIIGPSNIGPKTLPIAAPRSAGGKTSEMMTWADTIVVPTTNPCIALSTISIDIVCANIIAIVIP